MSAFATTGVVILLVALFAYLFAALLWPERFE